MTTEHGASTAEAAEAAGSTEPGNAAKNERSAIAFPYNDLNFAITVARAIHEHAGQSCAPDQLAAWMGQNVRSGAFAAKLSVARIFGLIETERGVVRLTDIGRRIVDPASEAAARVDAFLHVPLYKAIYDKYRGYTLPPAAALEREMAALGVSSKQTDKARQAFERSAEQSAFFATGRERLVMPAVAQRPDTKPIDDSVTPERKPDPEVRRGGGGGGEQDDLHPFVVGLLRTLPKPETDWPAAERTKWLRTAAGIFDLIYEGDDGGVIVVELKASPATNPFAAKND